MKIAFLNPPLNDWHFSRSQRSPGVIKSGTMYYPYWLAYATALATERGHECLLLDCPADWLDRDTAKARLTEFAPDLVVVETSTPSIGHDLETVTILKAALPDAKFCCSGTHVTSEWKVALDSCPALDFVAIG